MTSIKNDLDYLREAISQLKDYLLGKDLLSWQLGRNLPSLTPGNLLLAQARLQARKLDEEQHNTFEDLNTHLNELKDQWRTAWEKKVENEFSARLRRWVNVLDDLAKDKDANFFESELRVRVLLELLKDEFEAEQAEFDLLENLDKRLRAQLAEGDFIWEAELGSAFPQEQYWFLYGGLR